MRIGAFCVLLCLAGLAEQRTPAPAGGSAGGNGRRGGQLVVAERSAPRTFNPVVITDNPTKTVLERINGDLIHINRKTFKTEPALAASWTASRDGRAYTIKLRPGLKFSDGHALTADDVVFTFQVYLDEKLAAPQRDLLIVAGKPIGVRKVDDLTIVVSLAEPYAVADRMFDGIAILPRHVLAEAYAAGTLAQQWSVSAAPASIVGTGPFRVSEVVSGERVVLERNPNYWKRDGRGEGLPYLDRLVFVAIPSTDTQWLRFTSGELDVMSGATADQFASLPAGRYAAADLGPGLEYNFLFFNQSDGQTGPLAARQAWFRLENFRHAVSAAIDREAIVKLVYRGRGEPLWGPVTSGNAAWRNASIPRRPRSVDRARQLLRDAGFRWREDGTLLDRTGTAVEFNIIVSSSRPERNQMATLIQNDLASIGIRVTVSPLEFGAFVARVTRTRDFDACINGIASGDTDPNPEVNVWLSSGTLHLWNPGQARPATLWEAEIDRLMRGQMTAPTVADRKRMFDKVQALLAEHEPMIFLASPNILVAAKPTLGNFLPAVLPHYALWNVDELYWRAASRD
jgi:peptide/nickel transport system substrate-binding protein